MAGVKNSVTFICPNCEIEIDVPIQVLQGGAVVECIECDTTIAETKKTD